MKIAIMQPYFFPYLGYFQLINAVDIFVFLDDVNYINRGWINRNRILNNGEPYFLTLNLFNVSQNRLINEISCGNNKGKILKTLQHCYGKAPEFKNIFPVLQEILQNSETNLAKFVANSIKLISTYVGINKSFLFSSNIHKDNVLKGQNKIIDICKRLNATTYINAIGGTKLYSYEDFKTNGIELFFIKSEEISYKQFSNQFIPDLSIIDVMMFNSKDSIIKMLVDYILE